MSGSESLTMTAGEICEMYRTAKKKSKQIGILAQLNSTTTAQIAEILRAGGYEIDGRSLRYAKAAKGDGERGDATSSVSLAADTFPSRGRHEGGEPSDTHTHTHTHTHRRRVSRSRYGGSGRSWGCSRRIARSVWGRSRLWATATPRPRTCSLARSERWFS